MRHLGTFALAACMLPGSTSLRSAGLPPPANMPVQFERDIQPLFQQRCVSCHGPEKQEGGLRWDLKSSALQGGLSGPVVLPGNSRDSRMIHLVAGLEPDLIMPQRGPRLTSNEIGLLRAWIDQGAAWPDDGPINEETHWAFKPARRHLVPTKSSEWPRNPIDNFILEKLEQKQLSPSPEADRRVLIRRLSYDLHGLPPLPEQVQRFVADARPDAFERLVDEFLASPRYGERWARHWLDVVHYGDSHGYDKDKPRANAWPYRDYIINAFNADKPYSRFVQEQLAADALFPDQPELTPALGFIAAGPWDFVGHVELPETKTDGLIARYNDRDDMVMTTMSTFMSLTVHCARCHNHKFDPISQRDYYSLQAVFAGVDRADRQYDSDAATQTRRDFLAAEQKQVLAGLAQLSNALAQVESDELAELDGHIRRINLQLPRAKRDSPANGYHSNIEKEAAVEKWVEVDLGKSHAIDQIKLIPARPTDFPDSPGFGFPRRFRVEISVDGPERTIVADHSSGIYANPGAQPVVLPLSGIPVRRIRIVALELWERTKDYVFALAELEAVSDGQNVAAGATVRALDSIETGRWSKKFLVDGYDSRQRLTETVTLTDAERRGLEAERDKLAARRRDTALTLISDAQRHQLQEQNTRLKDIEKALQALPSVRKVYAASSDFPPEGSFRPARAIRTVHFLRRGDVKHPTEAMPPGALTKVPTLEHGYECGDPSNERARRAALANWLTDPRNMLGRRSIVNRIWHYHFGRGLVDSPNDFGKMGSQPSHPELLDWLAFSFIDRGESLKQLHRLILTSTTWRQTSVSHLAEAGAADADNRFLWRMNRRRLDAEEVRDALLHVSGNLNLQMGGPAVQMFYFKDDHSPVYDYSRYQAEDSQSGRRSVYRFIVRSVPDPFMDCLDAADPNLLVPQRNTTLTALQALSLLNNNFVVRQAGHFADRIARDEESLDVQIRNICIRALGRGPTWRELEWFSSHAREYGLPSLCRLIFNSNEFIFVD